MGVQTVKPYVEDADFTLLNCDVLDGLRSLADESVHCVVCSPPYWGLRDYGTGLWEGGDAACDHAKVQDAEAAIASSTLGGGKKTTGHLQEGYGSTCARCGARRVDQQLGLEPTPEAYVARMVEVFREVRRVLRADGTCWLNIGDSYAGGGGFSPDAPSNLAGAKQTTMRGAPGARGLPVTAGLKAKDLVGIPWRLAFALQADGWCLRSDIVWSKPNPMPESVTDRPTKAHEMVFLLTKARWVGPERGRFSNISDEDARWLALLFDAEGNVVVKKAARTERVQYGAQVAFANTNRALIEQAQSLVGMGSIHERPGTNAPMFYWQMTGQQARDLLYRIYPFLIVKPRQAALAIHMQDVIAEPKKRPGGYRTAEHSEFLDKCWVTMKALNSFEHPDLSWVPEPSYGKWVPERYFFDQEAVRESAEWARWGDQTYSDNGAAEHYAGRIKPRTKAEIETFRDRSAAIGRQQPGNTPDRGGVEHRPAPGGRNVRSVWEIATQPYPDAHFATYPEELVRRCILAGSSERGCCPVCGKPWEREVERGDLEPAGHTHGVGLSAAQIKSYPDQSGFMRYQKTLVGWRPGCGCAGPLCPDCGFKHPDTAHHPKPISCTILDPFLGSGTTSFVARKHGRRSIGIELSTEYCELAARRMQQQSLFSETAA